MTDNSTKIDGRLVQRANTLKALRLAQRHGYVRAHELALGLFPDRTFSAAASAAQRVLHSCIKAKVLQRRQMPNGERIYGVTTTGARMLRAEGVGPEESTLKALREASHVEHRSWSTRICLHAEARGAKALGERELLQRCTAFRQAFGKIPDVLAEWPMAGGPTLVTWHEVDLSVRNRRDGEALLRLVQNFVRVPEFDHEKILSAIVIHCGSRRVWSSVRHLLNAHYQEMPERSGCFELDRPEVGDSLVVWAIPLPEVAPWTTDDLLPWPKGGPLYLLPLLCLPPVSEQSPYAVACERPRAFSRVKASVAST